MKKLFVIFSVLSAIFIMADVIPSVWAQAQGGRLFDARMDFPAGDEPCSVAIKDLNGDGYQDLATANSRSNDVSILLGNGDGTFQTATDYGVGNYNPQSVAIGDLNGDGYMDLATANCYSNDVGVLIHSRRVTSAPILSLSAEGTACTISWTAISNATGYLFYYAPYPNPTPISSIDIGNQTGPFQVQLWDGTAFYIAVQAYNSAGPGGFSNIEHFVLAAAPDPRDVDDDGD